MVNRDIRISTKTIQENIFIFKRQLNNAPMFRRMSNKKTKTLYVLSIRNCVTISSLGKCGTKFKQELSRGVTKYKATNLRQTVLPCVLFFLFYQLALADLSDPTSYVKIEYKRLP